MEALCKATGKKRLKAEDGYTGGEGRCLTCKRREVVGNREQSEEGMKALVGEDKGGDGAI